MPCGFRGREEGRRGLRFDDRRAAGTGGGWAPISGIGWVDLIVAISKLAAGRQRRQCVQSVRILANASVEAEPVGCGLPGCDRYHRWPLPYWKGGPKVPLLPAVAAAPSAFLRRLVRLFPRESLAGSALSGRGRAPRAARRATFGTCAEPGGRQRQWSEARGACPRHLRTPARSAGKAARASAEANGAAPLTARAGDTGGGH